MTELITVADVVPLNLLWASAPAPLSDSDRPLEPSATAREAATEVAVIVASDFALTVTAPVRWFRDPSRMLFSDALRLLSILFSERETPIASATEGSAGEKLPAIETPTPTAVILEVSSA